MKLKSYDRTRRLERSAQALILGYLNTVCKAYRLTAQRRGSPDVVAVYKGRFVAFEVKREGKSKLKSNQVNELKSLLECDAFAFFVKNLEEVKSSLRIIDLLLDKKLDEAYSIVRTDLSLAQPIIVEMLKSVGNRYE